MNIALVGYGKMGHAIEEIATKRGHNVVLRITSANKTDLDAAHLQGVDVAIEFTRPESARENVLRCMEAGVSVVCGTTGWNEYLPEMHTMAAEHNVGFLHASNFSIGVNIFFEVNKLLASLMNGREEYDISIEETHHIHKKDAPSGTAITLADQIVANVGHKTGWTLNIADDIQSIPIIAHRVGAVPGTHKVAYSSLIDDIEIIHTAHNRDGFAIGAVFAAEHIVGKKGAFSMKDVLGIK